VIEAEDFIPILDIRLQSPTPTIALRIRLRKNNQKSFTLNHLSFKLQISIEQKIITVKYIEKKII
jgi:hypothetical protein